MTFFIKSDEFIVFNILEYIVILDIDVLSYSPVAGEQPNFITLPGLIIWVAKEAVCLI
jgi:hypothetical protein